ncbi:tyrosine-type recombinase/integrase [Schlesneria sp. DSM 10557]|uniref:tyrosine-type recombinase/integrase n=1 Tax=Schlesneria sp. DSM 10557 TaxID=3044399 RepID=UPI0035A03690
MANYKPSDVVTIGNVTRSLNEWAAELQTPVQTILGRILRGHSVERACTAPIEQANQNKGRTFDADVLDTDEVERLLQAAKNGDTAIRDRALIVLAYRSGLRCSEILALRPKDIDVTRGTVSVHHGKGDKARVVALDPAGWAHIAEWMALRSNWRINETSPIFCTRKGGKINSRQVRAMFARRAKKAKIAKRAHAHGMRRTMASEMAAEGIPLIDISGALGHSNVATTDTYIKRVNPASVVNAMRARGWGQSQQVNNSFTSSIIAPDWLSRLKADIGERLMLIHDGRTSETEFKAVVLLF